MSSVLLLNVFLYLFLANYLQQSCSRPWVLWFTHLPSSGGRGFVRILHLERGKNKHDRWRRIWKKICPSVLHTTRHTLVNVPSNHLQRRPEIRRLRPLTVAAFKSIILPTGCQKLTEVSSYGHHFIVMVQR